MKKIFTIIICFALLLSSALTAFAADGKVTYSGNAGDFIFEPGSEHSLSDLFPNFKGVMPGDSLSQMITVKNDADNKVKVKIYIRSLGAHEDSVDFLSQLDLKVKTSAENEMAYMFDAKADETAGLTDWVCLGTLYSGGEVNLDVTLDVPKELDSGFQNAIGYLDWEFMIEEFPIEPEDPDAPQTGDDFNTVFWVSLLLASVTVIFFILLFKKKKNNKEEAQN